MQFYIRKRVLQVAGIFHERIMEFTKLLQLLLLAILMALITYFAGIIPLKISISSEKLERAFFFSNGIILGTCFMIIIPEGLKIILQTENTIATESMVDIVGISLTLGYLSMYLLDNATTLIEVVKPIEQNDYTQGYDEISVHHKFLSLLQSPLTIGLTLHALMDGLSLGASFAKSEGGVKLGFAFFLIIVIHKLPVCLSLASLLLTRGLNEKIISFHVLVFSFSSPASSLLTFFILSLFKLQNDFIIGTLVLFSSGTVLYIISHITSNSTNHTAIPRTADSGSTLGELKPPTSLKDMLLFICGISIPVALMFIPED